MPRPRHSVDDWQSQWRGIVERVRRNSDTIIYDDIGQGATITTSTQETSTRWGVEPSSLDLLSSGAKFKVGDIVIVNQKEDIYTYTKPGSYGVVEKILAGGEIYVAFTHVTGLRPGGFPPWKYPIYPEHLDLYFTDPAQLEKWKAEQKQKEINFTIARLHLRQKFYQENKNKLQYWK